VLASILATTLPVIFCFVPEAKVIRPPSSARQQAQLGGGGGVKKITTYLVQQPPGNPSILSYPPRRPADLVFLCVQTFYLFTVHFPPIFPLFAFSFRCPPFSLPPRAIVSLNGKKLICQYRCELPNKVAIIEVYTLLDTSDRNSA
jgi:hypothetical protein